MFLEFAPAYFEYMAKAFYNNIPSVLCKILGVYTLGYHNKETGKKVRGQISNITNFIFTKNENDSVSNCFLLIFLLISDYGECCCYGEYLLQGEQRNINAFIYFLIGSFIPQTLPHIYI